MTSEIDICYKSTTFCDGAGGRCLKFNACPMALTEKVKEKAQRWWEANGDTTQDGPAIAIIAAPSKMDCYEPPKKMDCYEAPKEDSSEAPQVVSCEEIEGDASTVLPVDEAK